MPNLQAVDAAFVRAHNFLVAGELDVASPVGSHMRREWARASGPDLPPSQFPQHHGRRDFINPSPIHTTKSLVDLSPICRRFVLCSSLLIDEPSSRRRRDGRTGGREDVVEWRVYCRQKWSLTNRSSRSTWGLWERTRHNVSSVHNVSSM